MSLSSFILQRRINSLYLMTTLQCKMSEIFNKLSISISFWRKRKVDDSKIGTRTFETQYKTYQNLIIEIQNI